ncbi:hypothetical protein D3C86_1837160 [compost metagenome]
MKLHKQRHEWTHDQERILTNFTHFEHADNDFDPHCLLGKYWEFIKEDIEEFVKNNKQ